MRHETESAVRALRFCEGGESVVRGDTQSRCAWCTNGICQAAFQACEVPEPEPPRPSLFQRVANALFHALDF